MLKESGGGGGGGGGRGGGGGGEGGEGGEIEVRRPSFSLCPQFN